MKKYTLFNEWKAVSIYGNSFEEAVLRESKFKTPDQFENGTKIQDGEQVFISAFLGMEDVSRSTRGDKKFIRGIFATRDGRIKAIDAIETEIN